MKRLSSFVFACLALTAVAPVFAASPAAATTSTLTQALGCGIGGNQTMTITGTAPGTVVQGTAYTVDLQPSQATAAGGDIAQMAWNFQIPTGATLVPGSVTT